MAYSSPERCALLRSTNQCIPHPWIKVVDRIEKLVWQDYCNLPAKPFTKKLYIRSQYNLQSSLKSLNLFVGGHPGVKAYVMQGPGEVANLQMVKRADHPVNWNVWSWQQSLKVSPNIAMICSM